MKVTNWKKKLASALVAAGCLAPAALHAAPLDTNILVDPGFEDVNMTVGGGYNALQLNSWNNGTSSGYTYASGVYDQGGPLSGGGAHYFTPNQSSNGDVTAAGQVSQTVDLSTGDSATLIAGGEAAYSLGAFFTSYASSDVGNIQVDFYDSGNNLLGTGTVSDSDNTTWTQNSGGGVIPIGTTSATVSVFGTANAGGPDGYADNADFQVTNVANVLLVMEVNTNTGAATISNATGGAFDIDYYEILSDTGSLSTTGWASLEDQNLAGFPAGDGTGNGWEEAGNISANVLSESYLQGNSTLADAASIAIGSPFNAGSGTEDLVFQYGLTDGTLAQGFVRYVSSGFQTADFNEDSSVNATDFALWQAGYGKANSAVHLDGDADADGDVDGADFLAWQQQFVSGSGNGNLSASGVPEPSSILLLSSILFGVGISLVHRNKRDEKELNS